MELETIENPADSGRNKTFHLVNEVMTAHAGRLTASAAAELVEQSDFEIDRLFVGEILAEHDSRASDDGALIFGRSFAACEQAARHATRRKRFTLIIAATRSDLLLTRNYLRLRAPKFENLSASYGVVVCKRINVAPRQAVAHG